MKAQAIVYVSNTGFTKRYAEVLGEVTGLPVYTAKEARKALAKRTAVVYAGWLFATKVKGYKAAARRFDVRAVCAVGLCPTGTLLPEVRKANGFSDAFPVFTVQGGMKRDELRGINKSIIDILIKMMRKKADKTEEE